MIPIEAFPIEDLISNLPNNSIQVFTPSNEDGERSFASVFASRTSERSSVQSTSTGGEKIKGTKKEEQGMGQVLGYQPTATNLLGVNEQVMSDMHAQPQSQEMVASSQGTLSQGTGLRAQILSQLGFTQEEIDKFMGAKDLAHLKALLLKLGLNTGEAEQFGKENPNALKGEEDLFLNKLIKVLEQKGFSPDQAREISKMLVELKIELPQVNKLVTVEEQPRQGIKELLLQLGVHPEEADKIIEEGKISIDRLREILLKLNMSPEEVDRMIKEGELSDRLSKILLKLNVNPKDLHKLLETREMPQSIKAILMEGGVNSKEVAKLAGMGIHTDKEVAVKELLSLLSRNLQNLSDGDATHLSEKDESSLGNNRTSHNSQGHLELNGRGQIDSHAIASREVAGEKTQINFDRVMAKTELPEPTSQKVMEQIVKGVRIQVAGGQTRAKITLQPPALGKLHMYIITEENQVKATFFAETPQVKEIIENNLPQLRQSFLEQGLKVAHFNVFVGSHPSENQAEQHRFFNAGTTPRSQGEGLEGEGDLAMEIMRKRAMGNHTVDLFI